MKIVIPDLVQSLKSTILSSTSFWLDYTFWGVVSAAVERLRCKATGHSAQTEADLRISATTKKAWWRKAEDPGDGKGYYLYVWMCVSWLTASTCFVVVVVAVGILIQPKPASQTTLSLSCLVCVYILTTTLLLLHTYISSNNSGSLFSLSSSESSFSSSFLLFYFLLVCP